MQLCRTYCYDRSLKIKYNNLCHRVCSIRFEQLQPDYLILVQSKQFWGEWGNDYINLIGTLFYWFQKAERQSQFQQHLNPEPKKSIRRAAKHFVKHGNDSASSLTWPVYIILKKENYYKYNLTFLIGVQSLFFNINYHKSHHSQYRQLFSVLVSLCWYRKCIFTLFFIITQVFPWSTSTLSSYLIILYPAFTKLPVSALTWIVWP